MRRARALGLLLLVTLAVVVAAEAVLRARGYSHHRLPQAVWIADELALRVDTAPDPERFWTLPENADVDIGATRFHLGDHGLRAPFGARERPPDALRVLCLGDGATFGYLTSYPSQLEDVLRRMSDREVEVINAGVPAYSSYQGVRLLEQLRDHRPDVVTFCFGAANATHPIDGRGDLRRAGRAGGVVDRARQTRIGQWIGARVAAPDDDGGDAVRVTPTEHRALLRRAAALCDDIGATLVVLTQPRADRPGAPDRVELHGAAPSSDRRRLDAQNYALRVEAGRLGVPLLDLSTLMEHRAAEALFVDCPDEPLPVQPNPVGARVIAELLAQFLLEQDIVDLGANARERSGELPCLLTPSSEFSWAAADLNADGLDELLLTAVVADKPAGAWYSPSDHQLRRQSLPLDPPTLPLTLAYLPALRGLVLVAHATADGKLHLRTLHRGGSPAFLDRVIEPILPGANDLRIATVDLEGDGNPEYVVGFGPYGPPYIGVLTEELHPTTMARVLGLREGQGVHLAAGHILSERAGHVLLGPDRGRPELRIYGLDRHFEPFSRQTFGLSEPPTAVALGHFFPSNRVDDLVVLRPPAIIAETPEGARIEPCFPFGAVRLDARTSSLAMTTVPSHLEGHEVIWIGSRTEDRISIIAVSHDAVSPVVELSSD